MKNSAGPPTLSEVCRASGWSRRTPGSFASQSRLARVRQSIRHLPDVSGPHEKQEVTLLEELPEQPSDAVQLGDEAGPRDEFGELPAAHLAGVRLARGVDLGHDHLVGAAQALGELVAEGLE